jgi:hypothetical protein
MGGNVINISSSQDTVKFHCDNGGVYSREIVFGDDENKDEDSCSQEYYTEQLTRLSKIAGLSTQIQIYQSQNLPFHIKSNIGNLGKISIFTKDKSQIEESEDNSE